MPYKAGKSFRNLNRKLKEWETHITTTLLQRGLYAGASVGAAYAATMTPIDTSNLINSQYITVRGEGFGARATVGYTASYAYYVHEAEGKLQGQARPDGSEYWGPSGESEFLRKGFEDNFTEIEQTIIRVMKI